MNSKGDFMFNFYELEQFVAFADYKTLTKVSEMLNISQPTLTRSMKHIESEFGVPLFYHGKNKLQLNKTGEKAVEYARQLLNLHNSAIQSVQEYNRKNMCITIASCAPKPLWPLASKTAQIYSDCEILSRLCDSEKIIADVENGSVNLGILPFKCNNTNLKCTPYINEKLFICATKDHQLYNCNSVTFADLNGFNCLLRDKIGFWADMCREKMPSSKFLVQTKEEEFIELARTSSLLCFTTNLVSGYENVYKDRRVIPITDDCANVNYFVIQNKNAAKLLKV